MPDNARTAIQNFRPMVNAASPQTLTFLFTDIEGSTPLWDTRPEAMRAATEQHNAILRETILSHDGHAFRVVGDAFCVAFADASAAIHAAVEAQRALRAHPWATDAPIHVRMGLHSGAVESTEDEIFRGPTLARAARVMSAGHGDQILATAATVALLEREVSRGASLRDLGDHTLRGFARPERLYQVVVPGLRAEFPPIRTQEAQRTNLPPALTSFIGRAQGIIDVREAAQRARMVTLVGPGGTGKTRLAIEAASELTGVFEDGVWLVELAPLADASFVVHAIAAVLGARAEGDVPPLTLVEAALRGKHALLLLDNCEHVVEEVAKTAQALLRTLPHLHLLASSREAIGVEGESVYRVPSMTMPDSADAVADVEASEAGALFAARARAVTPAFAITEKNAAAVARICRRLDGIPLAIELAAARLTALSVDELARRVDDRFRLLTGGRRTALPRQRTLRALVDWSYDLLSAQERLVLDTLAVFSGGFTLQAAETVCATDALRETTVLDAIEHLVAKSLVIAETQRETETRYRLLETIRQYAAEKLAESAEADAARRRHFAFFVDLARSAARAINGPLALEWLDRLETEHDNLRAALDWSADASPPDYARLAGALADFWDTRGYFAEGWTRLDRALALHSARDEARLHAVIGAGQLAYRLDYNQRSDDILTEAIALAQELGDIRGEAAALDTLGAVRIWRGLDTFEPLAMRARALAKSISDAPTEGWAVFRLGQLAMNRGEFAKAQSLFLECAAIWNGAGCVLRAPVGLLFAGDCAFRLLDFAGARRLLDAALIQHRRMGNVHDAATALRMLGELELNERRFAEARAHCAESVRVFRALQDRSCGGYAAEAYAAALFAQDDHAAALREAEAAAAAFRELGAVRDHALAGVLGLTASIRLALGERDAARQALRDALVVQRRTHRDHGLPELLEKVAAMNPDARSAPALLGIASALREQWHVPVFPGEREEYERCYADVRAKHDADEFQRALAAGRTLERETAMETALTLVGDDRLTAPR